MRKRTCFMLLALLLAAVPAFSQSQTETFSVAGASSPEGLPLTYQWSVTPAGPTMVGDTTDTVQITFTDPDTYTIAVSVSDGVANTDRNKQVVGRFHMPPVVPEITGPDEAVIIAMVPTRSGPFLLQAECVDNVGCVSVQFKIAASGNPLADVGPLIQQQLTTTYEYSLDSTIYQDGLHMVGAEGCDAEANCADASAVPVLLANGNI